MNPRSLAHLLAPLVLLVSLIASQTGCTYQLGEMTFLSRANVGLEPEILRRGVQGQDCIHVLLGLIPVDGWTPDLEDAMDEAIERAPEANLLTDATIHIDVTNYILLSRQCLRVEGDAGVLR